MEALAKKNLEDGAAECILGKKQTNQFRKTGRIQKYREMRVIKSGMSVIVGMTVWVESQLRGGPR